LPRQKVAKWFASKSDRIYKKLIGIGVASVMIELNFRDRKSCFGGDTKPASIAVNVVLEVWCSFEPPS
jgi:hypothetical protein